MIDVTPVSQFAASLLENTSRVMVGKENECRLLICALLARGHVLLQDVPGTGKTVLARTMARLLRCDFTRVQCTPDLLPGDITGSSLYDPGESKFVFEKGPVFTTVLLCDELNRATPRTQSALLECMEERQVSFGGETYRLPESFFVIATQHPIEIQGTFPLPEAQLDRFLMRLSLGYPASGENAALLMRFMQKSPLETLEGVTDEKELCAMQALCAQVTASQAVCEYIAAVCEKTRSLDHVTLGISTRGMLALLRACQAWAAMNGRDYVIPDDVKAVAVPVLAHRLRVRGALEQTDAQKKAVESCLAQVAVPTETI